LHDLDVSLFDGQIGLGNSFLFFGEFLDLVTNCGGVFQRECFRHVSHQQHQQLEQVFDAFLGKGKVSFEALTDIAGEGGHE